MNKNLQKLWIAVLIIGVMIFFSSCGESKSGESRAVVEDIELEAVDPYFEPTEVVLDNGMSIKGTHIPFNTPLIGEEGYRTGVRFSNSIWSEKNKVLYMNRDDKIMAFAYKDGQFVLNKDFFDEGELDLGSIRLWNLTEDPTDGELYGIGSTGKAIYKIDKDGIDENANLSKSSSLPAGTFLIDDKGDKGVLLGRTKLISMVKSGEKWEKEKEVEKEELIGCRSSEETGFDNGEILIDGFKSGTERYLGLYDKDFKLIKMYNNDSGHIVALMNDFFIDKNGNLIVLDGIFNCIVVFDDNGEAVGRASFQDLSDNFLRKSSFEVFPTRQFIDMGDGSKVIILNKSIEDSQEYETIALKIEIK